MLHKECRAYDAVQASRLAHADAARIPAGLGCHLFAQRGDHRLFRALGVAGSVAVVAISEGVDVPLNRVVKATLADTDEYSET